MQAKATARQEHPLVLAMLKMLERGADGQLRFATGLSPFVAQARRITDPAETLALTTRLVDLAYFLDVHKGAKSAAKQVIAFAEQLLPALGPLLLSGAQQQWEAARAHLAQQRRAITEDERMRGLTGSSSRVGVSLRRKR